MAEIGNRHIFVAENGNVVHILADSYTKIVNETEISFSDRRKTEIFNMIVTDIKNHRSEQAPVNKGQKYEKGLPNVIVTNVLYPIANP